MLSINAVDFPVRTFQSFQLLAHTRGTFSAAHTHIFIFFKIRPVFFIKHIFFFIHLDTGFIICADDMHSSHMETSQQCSPDDFTCLIGLTIRKWSEINIFVHFFNVTTLKGTQNG